MIGHLHGRSAEGGLVAIVAARDLAQRQSLTDHAGDLVEIGLMEVGRCGDPMLRHRLVQRQVRQIGLKVLSEPHHTDVGMDEFLPALELVAGFLFALADHHRDAGDDLQIIRPAAELAHALLEIDIEGLGRRKRAA